MGYRALRLALLLAVVGAALVVAATAHAQAIDPVPGVRVSCNQPFRYDINGDSLVDRRDMEMWVRSVHESGESCKLDGPAAGCPRWVDINGDGFVSHADLTEMYMFIRWCRGPSLGPQPPR